MDDVRHDPWWAEHFLPAGTAQGADFVSRDGGAIVEVKRRPQGVRGIYAGAVQLAAALKGNRALKHAVLVIDTADLSLRRVQSEWAAIRPLFRDAIAERLSLVALSEDEQNSWISRDDPLLESIRFAFLRTWFRSEHERLVRIQSIAGQRYFEIAKVLLDRWLRNQGQIAIGELAKHVGCTYPTVRAALRRLESKKYLSKKSGRFVELTRFPQETWRELTALAPSMRRPLRFIDESGEKPNPDRLLDRLQTVRPKRIALGGVLAARHWNPDFDLHGTPRLDLVAHAPDGVADLRFLKRLDPALQQTDDLDAAPALVIHPLVRAAAGFIDDGKSGLPFADPVETVLDLQELGLAPQASQLLSHLRKEVRL